MAIKKATLPQRKEYAILGSVLGQLREEFGLTQRALARKLGRPETTIGKIEAGRQRVDLVELYDIARALRISVPELVRMFDEALGSKS